MSLKTMKYFFSLSVLLVVSACGSKPGVSDVQLLNDTQNLSGTVSVTANSPEDQAVNVAPNSDIVLDFSGPIKESSIDRTSFRVEDQFGFELPGKITMEKGDTRIRWAPQQNGARYALPPGRKITVKSRFLQDSKNRLVGDYAWSFRPLADVGVDEDFKIVEILPEESLILPGGSIAVRFSQELAPPDDTTTLCSQVQWAESFQIFRITIIDQSGQITFSGVPGEACIKQDENGDFKILQFYPLIDGQPAGLPSNSYVDVVVKPSDGLRSLESSAMLSNSTTQRLFIMPHINDIIGLIFEY